MANEQNLKPIQKGQLSKEELKKRQSNGGKASGKASREKKTMKQMLDYLLEKKIKNKDGKKATTLEAMMTSVVARAIKGDIKAAQFVRDTIGEMPKQKVEITGNEQIEKGLETLNDLLQ